LQAVNDLLHNHALARNLPAELRYRGPQCWSQRRELARAAYEPLEAMNAYAAESARRAAALMGDAASSGVAAGDHRGAGRICAQAAAADKQPI